MHPVDDPKEDPPDGGSEEPLAGDEVEPSERGALLKGTEIK